MAKGKIKAKAINVETVEISKPNIKGNYNHDNEGVVTEKFLTNVIEASGKSHYLTVRGYFNLPKTITLQSYLCFMHSKSYKFVSFITQDRNIGAEILFERF